MIQASSTMSASELLQATATPALFARLASQGRWRTARHLLAMDRAITETIVGRSPKVLLIEAPPRHGKSELVSKYLPAWFLGTFPDRRVMLTSYEAGFARSWGRRVQEVFERWGPRYFGVRLNRRVRAASEWTIEGHEGGMFTAGVGGPLTGKGADLLIIDDPVKNSQTGLSETLREGQWDWWQSTASTRLEPGGTVILIGTRWHEYDLAGRLLESEKNGGWPVRRLRLPALAEVPDALGRAEGEALWPERWPRSVLEERARASDPYWW